MIIDGHRDAAEAEALGPRGPAGECPQRISFTFPIMAGNVAPVQVFPSETHFLGELR